MPSTTWTATPQEVERVIGAVLPHASSDDHLPMICVVRMEIANDQFIAVATDRYTLAVAWAKLTDWEEDAPTHQDAAACVSAGDLRRLFAFLKPHKRTNAVWTLTETSLTAAIGEESLTVRTTDVTFVTWRPLVGRLAEQAGKSTGVPVMRFSPCKITPFLQSAKALGEDWGSMNWHYGSTAIDAPLVQIGDSFIGLLMPQRLEEKQPALDLSAIGIESPKAVAA